MPITRTPLRQKALTAALGAAVGVGLGGLGVAMLSRGHGCCGPARTFPDEGIRAAFEKTAALGPVAGTWEIQEGDSTRRRVFEDDPARPDVVRCIFDEDPLKQVHEFPRERVAARVAGDAGAFFGNYRPAGPVARVVEGHFTLRVQRWERGDCSSCASRWIYVDEVSGEVMKFEDRSWQGLVVYSARRLDAAPPRTRSAAAASTAPSEPSRRLAPFAEFLKNLPLPLYEPSRLPAGFRRVAYEGLHLRSRLTPPVPDVDVAVVAYGDGIALVNVLVARREDMQTLLEVARRQQRGGGVDSCPATDAPVEDVGEPNGAVVIRRRSDKCRTVLQRDDLPGVSVVLVGFNEVPENLYVETLRSLVRVPGSLEVPPPK